MYTVSEDNALLTITLSLSDIAAPFLTESGFFLSDNVLLTDIAASQRFLSDGLGGAGTGAGDDAGTGAGECAGKDAGELGPGDLGCGRPCP